MVTYVGFFDVYAPLLLNLTELLIELYRCLLQIVDSRNERPANLLLAIHCTFFAQAGIILDSKVRLDTLPGWPLEDFVFFCFAEL